MPRHVRVMSCHVHVHVMSCHAAAEGLGAELSGVLGTYQTWCAGKLSVISAQQTTAHTKIDEVEKSAVHAVKHVRRCGVQRVMIVCCWQVCEVMKILPMHWAHACLHLGWRIEVQQ